MTLTTEISQLTQDKRMASPVRTLLAASLMAVTVPITLAYLTGAPDSVCTSMTPTGHGGSAQTTTAPYTVQASDACYTPGKPITVTLLSSGGATYRGFLMQARKPNDAGITSYGTFSTNGDTNGTPMSCFGSTTNNAITHNNGNAKTAVSFRWTAPTTLTENVTLTTTVVKVFSTFWIQAVTATLPPCSTSPPTSTASYVSSSINASPSSSTWSPAFRSIAPSGPSRPLSKFYLPTLPAVCILAAYITVCAL